MESIISRQWRQLCDHEADLFRRQSCESVGIVYNEVSFRRQFEKICAEHHEPDAITLFAKLQTSFGHVESFRNTLEGLKLEGGKFDPSQLLWGGVYAVIEVRSLWLS